jgi:hypothetical protein
VTFYNATIDTDADPDTAVLDGSLSTDDGEKMPAKVYSLLAFDGKDAAGADICRIVAIHATAQYERVTEYDVAWLEPRPGLIITSEGGALSTPALDAK